MMWLVMGEIFGVSVRISVTSGAQRMVLGQCLGVRVKLYVIPTKDSDEESTLIKGMG